MHLGFSWEVLEIYFRAPGPLCEVPGSFPASFGGEVGLGAVHEISGNRSS